MRKNLIVNLFVVFVCFILSGCGANESINNAVGVTMTIKEGTLTKTGATVVITDVSGKKNVYGEEYRIDKLQNGKWKELEVIVEGNYGWNLIGYYVGEDNTLELEHNWEWLYGELEIGEYRLVKNTSESGDSTNHYFSVQFTID